MNTYADFTYLDTFLRCPRQWDLRYVQLLEPRTEGKSMPLLAGSLIHKLLELHYTGKDVQAELPALYAASGISPFGDFAYMTEGHFSVIMAAYAEQYREDSKFRTVTMLEEPLTSDTLLYGGIPDMIVENADGELEIWDHKCTTSYMSNLERRHALSRQFPLYAVLASEKLGRPIRRAVLNGIFMGKGASNPTSKAEKWLRKLYQYTNYQLTEAMQWRGDVNEMIKATDVPPMHPDVHCDWCEFKRICGAQSETVALAEIQTNFRERKITGKLLSGADMEEG